MQDKILGAIWGGFAADALALGVHWVYDPQQIRDRYGVVRDLCDPELANWHKAKRAGDFTPDGDQMVVLLESLAVTGSFDPRDFMQRWSTRMADYEGYVGSTPKKVLAQIAAGGDLLSVAAESDGLGAAARMTPLALRIGDYDKPGFIDACLQYVTLTDRGAELEDATRLLAHLLFETLHGTPVKESVAGLDRAASELGLTALPLDAMLAAVAEQPTDDPTAAVQALGPACGLRGSLPSTIYLAQHGGSSLEEVAVANANAGGQSASRGMLLGALFGAEGGLAAAPTRWVEQLNAHDRIEQALAAVAG